MPTEATGGGSDGPELVIRPADPGRPGEADAIAALYTAARVAAVPSMPPAVHSAEEDRAWFAARLGDREAWLAEEDGALAGFALLGEEWLDHLFVRPGATGRGVGSALLDVAKARRPHGFELWVFESNAGARRFYARHGLLELERTDGSGNEERAPDVRMTWPGREPLARLRRLIDQVDEDLADLLVRRAALTRAVQEVKGGASRDPDRERAIVAAMARRAPALGEERLARIVHAIITESLDAAD